MGVLNGCDFETGDASEVEFDAGLTPTVQSTIVYSGHYAAQQGPGLHNAFWLRGIGPANLNAPVLYSRHYVRFGPHPDWYIPEPIVAFYRWVGYRQYVVELFLHGLGDPPDSLNVLGMQVGSYPDHNGTTVLAEDTWHCIEIKYVAGIPGTFEVRLNGETEIIGSLNNTAVRNCDGILFGETGVLHDMYVDDIMISGDDWIGPYVPPEPSIAFPPIWQGNGVIGSRLILPEASL